MLEPPAFRFPVPRDIERLAFEAGGSIAALCKRAKVTPQTFRNWKFGRFSPSLDTVQRLVEAGTALLAEAQGTATAPATPTRSRRKPAGKSATTKSAPRAKAAAAKRPARGPR
jgi:transcriptional regulator with XRE-family HTH domain